MIKVYKNKKLLLTWLWSGVMLILLMVLIGGITRLTGSGLSMVKWELISGSIPPLSETQWQKAFSEYQQFPEFQQLNYRMDVEGFKKIFWWEYSHRLPGRITGIVFIFPFLFFLFSKSLSKGIIRSLLLIMLPGMTQGLMGWVMVKSGLQNNPHVSHYRLAMHLSLALALVSSLLWLIFRINFLQGLKQVSAPVPVLRLSLLTLFFLFIQISLGALVAGLKAGFAYNTFPLMNGNLLPPETFSYGNPFYENGIFLQFAHRWLACGVVGAVFILWRRLLHPAFSSEVQFYVNILLWLCFLQLIAGISTLVLAVPLVLGVIHQLLAFLLFGFALLLYLHVKYCPFPTSAVKS